MPVIHFSVEQKEAVPKVRGSLFSILVESNPSSNGFFRKHASGHGETITVDRVTP